MSKDFFANLHERNFFTERTTTGLLSVLPRLPTVTYDDSFCRFVRPTGYIPLSEILSQFHQGEYERIAMMASWIDYEFKSDEATDANVMNILTMYEMMNCGARAEFKLGRMLWTGNPANNAQSNKDYAGFYREFKGFEIQAGNAANVALEDIDDLLNKELTARDQLDNIEFVIVLHPALAHSWRREVIIRYEVDGCEYRVISDYAIPEYREANGLESSLYIIPLSSEGAGEPVTYLEYADYQQMVVLPGINDDIFWTDNGFYAWMVEQERWDYKLSVRNESRLALKRPDLVTKFDVKYRSPA